MNCNTKYCGWFRGKFENIGKGVIDYPNQRQSIFSLLFQENLAQSLPLLIYFASLSSSPITNFTSTGKVKVDIHWRDGIILRTIRLHRIIFDLISIQDGASFALASSSNYDFVWTFHDPSSLYCLTHFQKSLPLWKGEVIAFGLFKIVFKFSSLYL